MLLQRLPAPFNAPSHPESSCVQTETGYEFVVANCTLEPEKVLKNTRVNSASKFKGRPPARPEPEPDRKRAPRKLRFRDEAGDDLNQTIEFEKEKPVKTVTDSDFRALSDTDSNRGSEEPRKPPGNGDSDDMYDFSNVPGKPKVKKNRKQRKGSAENPLDDDDSDDDF